VARADIGRELRGRQSEELAVMTMAGRYVAGVAGLALVVSLVGCSVNGGKKKP
jgi:hypothetical protein